MGRKKLFSLIEIAVAMAVAAIGVAAIMALLPIAIKSSSDSVGDTLAADAANTVVAQLDRAAWEHFDWIQDLPQSKSGTPYEGEEYANKQLGENSYKIEPADGLQKGHFVFLFGPPGKKSDFAAEVYCWQEDQNNLKLSSMDPKTGNTKTILATSITHPVTKKPALVRVYIEITWPLAKPYSKNKVYPRQSRTFVRDYFDPTYYKVMTD